jgi:adenylate cyclase
MVVGNLGSTRRFDYTVVGDAVNLGSRLEGTTKVYGTRIIISESTYAQVQGKLLCRELDLIRVKGKSQPIAIYELVSRMPGSVEDQAFVEVFQRALSLYRARQWEQAEAAFGEVLAIREDDRASLLYLERLAVLKQSPPEAHWDGCFTMLHK